MFLFVLVCIMLLGIILLQSSKGGGLGAAVSGQSMNEALGGEGADKLMVRLTRILAIVFMVLAIWIGKNTASKKSLLDNAVVGCMDVNAPNYDPKATSEGKCEKY